MRAKIILSVLITAILSTSLLAANPKARDAFGRGYQLFEAGQYYPAINSFKLALNDPSYPLLDYGYYYIAEAYKNSRNFEEAVQVYAIVLKHYKNSILIPDALYEMAACQYELQNYSGAAITLNALIAQYPNHEFVPAARYLLGLSLEQTGSFEAAARAYRNLDLLHPDSLYAEKALDRLDQLAQESPLAIYEAPAATVYNLGVKYFKSGNYTKAKGYFTRIEKFYRKSSFYDEAIFMLGRLQLRKGNYDLAVKYFNRAINLNKDSKPEAMLYLGITCDYQDSPQAAITALEKLVRLYPNSAAADDALFYIGRYYRDLGKWDEAINAYEKIITSYPNSDLYTDAIWMVGKTYYQQSNYQRAYDSFSLALQLPPDKVSDQLLFWTAKCAGKIGETDKAIAGYKAAIARRDHSYYGYRAREELKKYGINIPPNAIPAVPEAIERINGASPETVSHEEKYRELLALGLGDEAAEEASFLEEKVPVAKKEKATLAKYHAYIMKGKFVKPIQFADGKIEEATITGDLNKVDPRIWQFCYPRAYWQYVEKYAKEYKLDPNLLYAVIREESRFKSQALSRSAAHGLMQIIPGTGRKISKDLGLRYSRWKMYEPRVNIQMGAYYLSTLIDRFDGNVSLALAGYNGGPNRVSKWLKEDPSFDLDEFVENIPLTETRNYVKKVLKSYYGYKRTYGS